MGEVRGLFTITNVKNGRSIEIDALVDSGAVVTTVSLDVAEALGLVPDAKAVVHLADESTVEMDKVNTVEIRYEDRATGNPLLILPHYGVETLVGQMTLEGLDLLVDCPRQRVMPRPESPVYASYKLK